MSLARQLYQLQEIDLEVEANEQALNQINRQLGESQTVINIQTKLNSERQHLEELQRQQRSTEWEVADLTAKLHATEAKLYGGKITNPKELTNLQNEAKILKTKRDHLEDKVLDIMEQTERLEASVVTLNDQLKDAKAEWQQQQQQLSSKLQQVKATLAELGSRREILRANLDTEVTTLYQQLRRQKGTAVSKVEQGICTCCRISVSTAKLQQVRSGSLVQCSNCSRILFLA